MTEAVKTKHLCQLKCDLLPTSPTPLQVEYPEAAALNLCSLLKNMVFTILSWSFWYSKEMHSHVRADAVGYCPCGNAQNES